MQNAGEASFILCSKKSTVCVFHKHELDTDLLKTLLRRFQSCFKTVQREQIQAHKMYLCQKEKSSMPKVFIGLIFNFNLASF